MADGIFNKFKMLIGVEDEDQEIETPQKRELPEPSNRASLDRSNTFVQPRVEPRESRVLNMQTQSKKPFKLVVIEPKSFDECPKLVDNLKSKRPVIINLEKIENETARKIFDFLSGATYALDGNVQKVANNIFVFAPENVDVVAGDDKAPSSGTQNASSWR